MALIILVFVGIPKTDVIMCFMFLFGSTDMQFINAIFIKLVLYTDSYLCRSTIRNFIDAYTVTYIISIIY